MFLKNHWVRIAAAAESSKCDPHSYATWPDLPIGSSCDPTSNMDSFISGYDFTHDEHRPLDICSLHLTSWRTFIRANIWDCWSEILFHVMFHISWRLTVMQTSTEIENCSCGSVNSRDLTTCKWRNLCNLTWAHAALISWFATQRMTVIQALLGCTEFHVQVIVCYFNVTNDCQLCLSFILCTFLFSGNNPFELQQRLRCWWYCSHRQAVTFTLLFLTRAANNLILDGTTVRNRGNDLRNKLCMICTHLFWRKVTFCWK